MTNDPCGSSFGLRHLFVIRSFVIRILHATAFRAEIGRGAKVVAAVFAEAGAMTSTGAEDGAETNGGEDGEEQSDEPVREHEGAPGGAGEVTKPRKSEEWGIRIHVVVVPTTPRRGLMGRDASELRMQLA